MSELVKTSVEEILSERTSFWPWAKLFRKGTSKNNLVQNLEFSKTKEDLEIVAFVNMSFPH